MWVVFISVFGMVSHILTRRRKNNKGDLNDYSTNKKMYGGIDNIIIDTERYLSTRDNILLLLRR